MNQLRTLVVTLPLLSALAACGGGAEAPQHTVGGTVTGLAGEGLVLQLNDRHELPIRNDGPFSFPPLTGTDSYAVAVKRQPSGPSQTCTVANDRGKLVAETTSVQVACATHRYRIGGHVTGLAGTGLVLQLNGAHHLPIQSDGAFNFPAQLDGQAYAVSIAAQPTQPSQTCTVTQGNNTLAGADVADIEIACTTHFSVGGTVAGMSGSGLVLQLNGAGELAVDANGRFQFPAFVDGSPYSVTVASQPTGPAQTCAVGNGSGSLTGADVMDVSVLCSPWTKQLGASAAYSYGNAVATDRDGNLYVAGHTTGSLDGGVLTGTQDLFLIRYEASGNRVYTVQLGAPGAATSVKAVTTDAAGHVYVAGYTQGGLDGNPHSGGIDGFVVKYDAAGNRLYTRQLGVAGANTYGYGVAADADGNVYLAGYTSGALDGLLNGRVDVFLAKYDAAGKLLYTRQRGAAGANTYGHDVATDTGGNVYVAGYTTGGLDGNRLTGTQDLFVLKYDAAGNRLYTRQMGIAGTVGRAITTDGAGNVYVVGDTTGNLDGNTLTGVGDLFLTKFDPTGSRLYTRLLGAAGVATWGYGVATDSGGNAYVTGYTYGALDGNTRSGNGDLFLAKYDPMGTRLYTRQLGAAEAYTSGYGIAVDGAMVYLTGYTTGGLSGHVRSGQYDLFVAKYDTSGILQ